MLGQSPELLGKVMRGVRPKIVTADRFPGLEPDAPFLVAGVCGLLNAPSLEALTEMRERVLRKGSIP